MNKSNKKDKKEKEKLPKAWKKLKPFFDEKKDAPRRLRAISTFLAGTNPPPTVKLQPHFIHFNK
jgi:hypothetical protein